MAWIAGILGNIAKAAKRRQQQASLPSQQPTAPAPRPADPQPDAEAVAREMRRILGQAERDEQRERERVVRPEPVTTEPVATAFEPPPLPRRTPPSLPSEQRRNLVEPARAPTPVVPTTAA
ncbi:MAG: hypothetical protein ACK6D2_05945, partial [Planctomycetota bacterium]